MKYAKIALIALAPVVLIVGLLMSGGNDGRVLPNTAYMMNVTTGEIISMPRKDVSSALMRDEEGRDVLIIAEQNESGEWEVSERYSEMLDIAIQLHGDEVIVDPVTRRPR